MLALALPAVLITMLLAATVAPASAARADRQREKLSAEQERAALRGKLAGLRREMEGTESARSHASDALAASERAISEANRALNELAQEQREAAERIDLLRRRQQALQAQLDQKKRQLGRLARDQVVASGSDRMQLLLSGDNPNRINRDLRYLDYVARAQAQLVVRLQADLAQVASNTEEIVAATAELDEIAADQRQQKAVLEKEKSKRAILLTSLSNKLESQRKEAGALERDEKRMALLLNRLSKLIEEQRQAELAQARQREAQQREAQQRKLAARKPAAGKQREPFRPDPIDADEKPAQAASREPAAVPAAVDMGALRGQLKLPVKGELVARFGSRRGEGGNWKGVFIRATEGAEVRSLAAGRIAYAEWLRGFGNLVIVDHGNHYLSVYGNNQAVLKQPGDIVKAGDVIASAGNSGGNEFSGLYFELRFQGRAVDPMQWMAGR
ncbi:MAG: peptidase family [Paucimonas sp.]|nr:peptidase family [Paucimonas sp.]